MNVLEIPLIAKIRQNHALEHATIHILTQRNPHLRLVGRTTPRGFLLYGRVNTEDVAAAATEALARLQGGESSLAVHPRCGTTLATAGVLAGLTGFALMFPRSKSRWEKLPQVLLAATAAVVLAQPLGLILQERVTTSPQVTDVWIENVTQQTVGQTVIHRVDIGRE